MPDIAGLDIQIGANIQGALRGFDNLTKGASATATAITGSMTKASGSIEKIPVATAKVSVAFDKINAKLSSGAFDGAGITNLISDFQALAAEGGTSVDRLTTTLTALKAAQDNAIDPTAIKIYQEAISEVSEAITRLQENVKSFGGGVLAFNTESIKAALVDVNKLSVISATPVKVNIIVSQDIQQALVGMEHLSDEIKQLATGGVTSIGQLTAAIKTLKAASLSATDVGSIAKYNVAIEKLTGEVTRLKGATIPAGTSITTIGKSSNTASQAIQNLGRVAQDLPFGFIGISNNLNPLLEGFQRLSKEAKDTGQSVTKLLVSSLTGAGGLGLALSVASAALTVATIGMDAWTRGFGGSKKAVDDAIQSNEDYLKSLKEINESAIKGAEKEVVSLKTFVAIAQDRNASDKIRLDAVVKLQELSPAYFGTLTKEQILYGNITDAINLTTKALFNKAFADAASSKASEAAARQYDLLLKIRAALKDEAEARKKINELNAPTVSVGTFSTNQSDAFRSAWSKSVEKVQELNEEFKKVRDEQAGFLADAKNFTLLTGEIGKTGESVKSIEGIFRDLKTTIDEINKKQIATGVSLDKEKIQADKKAIEDLLKTSIDLKDIRLTGLIAEFKALGGTFDEVAKKGRSIKTISDVLAEMGKDIDLLNTKEISLGTDEIPGKIKAIESAINKLKDLNVPADSTIIKKLFGDIKDLNVEEDLQKLHERIQAGMKSLDLAAIIPVKINFAGEGKELKDSFKDQTLSFFDQIIDLQKFASKNHIKINIDLTKLTPEQLKDFTKSIEDPVKALQESIKATLTDTFTGVFEGIGTALGGGENPLAAMAKLLGESFKAIGAALIKYGVIQGIINKIFANPFTPAAPFIMIGAGIALEALSGLILKSLPHFEEGGITTGTTMAILHKNELVLPLDRLNEFITPGNQQPIVMDVRIKGPDILLTQNRTMNQNRRTY